MIPPTVEFRICTICNASKPIGEFHRNKNYPGGHINQCKPCRMGQIKAWRKANPEKVFAIRKRYQATDKCKEMWKRSRLRQDPARRKANLERWKAEHPDRLKYHSLKKSLGRRGMHFEEYEKFAELHGNHCCICGAPPESKERRLAIDHCHRSGENRGLLCINCNTMIGMANDSVEILRKAINYLERWESRTKSGR